jgi:hypothetical protein
VVYYIFTQKHPFHELNDFSLVGFRWRGKMEGKGGREGGEGGEGGEAGEGGEGGEGGKGGKEAGT